MAKGLRMNLRTGELTELGGTDLLPHPASFPLGSAESRAAARAMLGPDRMRAGDKGTFKCGCIFFVVPKIDSQGDPTGGLIQIILPGDWSKLSGDLSSEHVHDYEVVA